jgi:sigma-B regulation protein RsbU (phosphoserine phosphatase)
MLPRTGAPRHWLETRPDAPRGRAFVGPCRRAGALVCDRPRFRTRPPAGAPPTRQWRATDPGAYSCRPMTLTLTTTLNGELRRWPLESGPVRIGRASANAVQVLDGTVSREHAELVSGPTGWTVCDLGTRNGTRVNGREATTPLPLVPGDRLEIGHVLLEVAGGEDSAHTRFTTSEHVGSALKLKVSDVLQRTATSSEGSENARVMHLLAAAGQQLVLPRPLAETCDALLGFVEKAVPSSRLVILLRNAKRGELEQVAARYRGGRAEEPLALSQTITRAVLADNTAVITSDATNDPRFLAGHSIIAQAIHSAMAVPLFDNEQVLGILYADSTNPAVTYGKAELELLTLLGNMAAVKITNARLLEAEQQQRRLQQELATAIRIQQNLLSDPPEIPGWCSHARIETCYEVGGDLYDFHLRPDGQLVVLVGDVSGKGMGAALLMSSTLSSARVLYDACAGPLDLVRSLNRVTNRSTDGRSFVTMFIGWLDLQSGRLRYVNAGHPEPHVVGGSGQRTLEATGIPVGMLPDFPWTEGETAIEPGAMLAVFSDGIPEAQHGEEFFEDARVASAIREAAAEPSLTRSADRVIGRIDEFAAGEHRADDVTLVLLRRD